MDNSFFTEGSANLRRSSIWHTVWHARFVTAGLMLLGCSLTVAAQQRPDIADLPEAPIPNQRAPQAQPPAQNKRFGNTLGLLSHRSVFFPELAYQKGPLSRGQKLALAADESIAPSRFVASGFIAAVEQAENTPLGYAQGWDAYGKRFGASMATSASENVFGTFLLPAVFRQDPRYFVEPGASFKRRVDHALRRVVVTRTDSGGQAFNVSGLLGALMAEGLANSYLPDDERTAGRTFQRFGIRIGVGAASDILKEYWPNIFKRLGMRKLMPDGSGRIDATAAKPSCSVSDRRC